MRPSARASIFRTLLSAPSWTGNAPGLLTLPTTNTLPASGTRTSSPPERRRLASASVPSISALTDTRCISEAGSPFWPGWVLLTRISDPATAVSPPARVIASSSVTGPVAWKVSGSRTAPATLIGRLPYSATVTVTSGSTTRPSSSSALATVFSRSLGMMPSPWMRCLSMGRRIIPSVPTRTLRDSSGDPYTWTTIRSRGPIFWLRRTPRSSAHRGFVAIALQRNGHRRGFHRLRAVMRARPAGRVASLGNAPLRGVPSARAVAGLPDAGPLVAGIDLDHSLGAAAVAGRGAAETLVARSAIEPAEMHGPGRPVIPPLQLPPGGRRRRRPEWRATVRGALAPARAAAPVERAARGHLFRWTARGADRVRGRPERADSVLPPALRGEAGDHRLGPDEHAAGPARRYAAPPGIRFLLPEALLARAGRPRPGAYPARFAACRRLTLFPRASRHGILIRSGPCRKPRLLRRPESPNGKRSFPCTTSSCSTITITATTRSEEHT